MTCVTVAIQFVFGLLIVFERPSLVVLYCFVLFCRVIVRFDFLLLLYALFSV